MKAKKRKKTPVKKRSSSYSASPRLFLIVIGLAIFLGFSSFLVRVVYENQPVAKGRLSLSQQVPSSVPYPYKNLDLRIAANTNYQGGEINKVQTLGTTNQVSKYIVSFPVILDNLTEYGLMTVPTTPMPAGGYPVIILCHGYTNPKNYSTTSGYSADMRFYSQHGFVVIKPDFRGQGRSRHSGSPEGAYYSMAYNTDLMSLIASVKQTNYMDKNNINLWGHSMGAYLALRAAVLSPDIKHVILLAGPVGTVQDMFKSYVARSDTSNLTANKIRHEFLLKYGSPLNNISFWKYTSPLQYLDKTGADFQIHVGTADKVVPPHFSADLDEELTKNNEPHEYYVYQGAQHGLILQRPEIWPRSLKFLSPSR